MFHRGYGTDRVRGAPLRSLHDGSLYEAQRNTGGFGTIGEITSPTEFRGPGNLLSSCFHGYPIVSNKSPTTRKAVAPRRIGPGPGRPPRGQAEQREQELLETALDLFLAHGYEGTSIEKIAAALGMAKRTIYALYPDKKALFMASLQRAINDWIVPVEVLRKHERDNLTETLFGIGQLLVDNVLTPQGIRLMRITNAESSRMPEISIYTYQQGTGPTLDYLTELLTRRTTPPLRDDAAKEAALAFLYLIVSGPANMTAWGLAMNPDDVQRRIRFNVQLFLNGFHAEQTLATLN